MNEFLVDHEQLEAKTKLSELLNKYMGGDSHVHSVFSNPETRHEADYSFEQISEFLQKEMANGQNTTEFIVLAEHPSDAGNPELIDGQDLLNHRDAIHEYSSIQESEGREYPKLFSGVEASIISPTGDVDVPNEVLAQMDLVIGSKHDLRKVFPESGGNPNASELTEMYLGLMNNPDIDVIGHLSRYVDYKVLTQMDWPQLFQTAKETNTALEINVNAPMPRALMKDAVNAGVPLFIGTDAHTLKEYQMLSEEDKKNIENSDDRLEHPMGVKYSFWKKISRILRTLEEAGTPPEQIISSSYERLNNWISKEKSERQLT